MTSSTTPTELGDAIERLLVRADDRGLSPEEIVAVMDARAATVRANGGVPSEWREQNGVEVIRGP